MHITKDETERMVFLRNVHQRTARGNVLVHVVSPFPSMLEIIRDLANSERVTKVAVVGQCAGRMRERRAFEGVADDLKRFDVV